MFQKMGSILNNKKVVPYLFIFPTIAAFVIFRIYPMVVSFYLSVCKWSLLFPEKKFIGIGHYVNLFQDPIFLKCFYNTLVYVVGVVPIGIAIAIPIALLLNTKIKLSNLFRAVYFLPFITSMVAAATIWKWLYQPRFGLFNFILSSLGLPAQGWLTNSNQVLYCMIIFSIWQSVGYYAIIFLAGLQAIPQQYYEAAKIDGASKFQYFFHITLPLLKATTLFVLVMWTIGVFQIFTPVFIMTEGGPFNSSNVVILFVYRTAFEYMKAGYGSAAAVVLFCLILIIVLLEMKFLRRGTIS